jgi:hypothetical protein
MEQGVNWYRLRIEGCEKFLRKWFMNSTELLRVWNMSSTYVSVRVCVCEVNEGSEVADRGARGVRLGQCT